MPLTVLIADDASEVRTVEKRLLENDRDIEVIGEATDASEGIRLTRDLKPRPPRVRFAARTVPYFMPVALTEKVGRRAIVPVRDADSRYTGRIYAAVAT